MTSISVELVFAPTATQLSRVYINCANGITLAALLQDQAARQFMLANGLTMACPVGVFAHKVKAPATYLLQNGDRVEWYRPLIATPMALRKTRASVR